MVSKAQKIRLGIFLLTGLSFLIILLVLVVGSKLMERRDRYYIIYDNTSVNGLNIGGKVMYNGISIGRIDDIRIDRKDITKVIVELTVKKDTPIKEDTEATLVMAGITGLKQIELSGGTNQAMTLEPDSFIKPGKSMIDNISDKAESIAIKIDSVLTNVVQITNQENQQNFSEMLANFKEISQNSKQPIANALNNIDSLTYQLALTTGKANQMVQQINKIIQSNKINNIVTNTEKFTANLSNINTKKIETELTESTQKLNETVTKANILLNRIDALVQKSSPDVISTIDNLRETVDNLNEFSRLISEDPSILIRSRKQNTNN